MLWLQDKVEVLDYHDEQVHSPSTTLDLPAVVRLKVYIKPWNANRIKLSRENIYLRDQHKCQYCGDKFNHRELTFDHVLPASRGGGKTWENIVTACRTCNHRKGNRTPQEARMPLLTSPSKPSWKPKFLFNLNTRFIPDTWRPYLFNLG